MGNRDDDSIVVLALSIVGLAVVLILAIFSSDGPDSIPLPTAPTITVTLDE